MDWYKGQEVVCIDAKSKDKRCVPPPLTENSTYIIHEIAVCRCGSVTFDVGLRSYIMRMLCDCGELGVKNTIHYASEQRFVPLDAWSEMEKLVKELIEPVKREIELR